MTDPIVTEVKAVAAAVPAAEVKVLGFWAKQVAWIKANPAKVATGIVVAAVVLLWKIL